MCYTDPKQVFRAYFSYIRIVFSMNHYDNPNFFAAYAQMYRSQQGLAGAGEWHQLQPLFPDLQDKDVLDLGCGYGWHCK